MKLTERESLVYELILKGHTYNEMSRILFLSHTTVKTHVASLLHKKGVESKEALLLQEIGSLKTKLEALAKEYQVEV